MREQVFLGALALAAGCIRAPDIVIVDRKTALEEQASGSFRGLSEELEKKATQPGPVPLTRGELEAAGVPGERNEALAEDEATADAARVDQLLVRRCLGEAGDGTLVETPRTCTGRRDPAEMGALVERANRSRWQVWRLLQQKQPRATIEEIRRAWREAHLAGVVCNGQVQRPDGAWEAKRC